MNVDELTQAAGFLKVSEVCGLLNCGRATVTKMIRQNVLPAEPLNPASKRKTWRVPTWAVRRLLGLSEPEPEYQSKLLAGRL